MGNNGGALMEHGICQGQPLETDIGQTADSHLVFLLSFPQRYLVSFQGNLIPGA